MIRTITITTDSVQGMCEILRKVHEQLKGNQDYIDSNIVLSEHNDSEEPTVLVWIAENVKEIPTIIL